jgi:hypothetical protein
VGAEVGVSVSLLPVALWASSNMAATTRMIVAVPTTLAEMIVHAPVKPTPQKKAKEPLQSVN